MIYTHERLLLPWIPLRQFMEHLDLCHPEDNAHIDEWMNKRAVAENRALEIGRNEPGVADGNFLEPVPGRMEPYVREFMQDPLVKNTYKGRVIEVAVVPIDRLISLQTTLLMDYVDTVRSCLPKEPTEKDVYETCLALNRPHAGIDWLKSKENQFLFSSDSRDLRVLDVRVRNLEGKIKRENAKGIPVLGLSVILGMALPSVSVAALGNRLFLVNGFHKLYALRTLGVQKVPAIIIRDPTGGEFPRDIPLQPVLSSPRPPLLRDFFDKDLTLDLRLRPKRRTIKIDLTTEMFDIGI